MKLPIQLDQECSLCTVRVCATDYSTWNCVTVCHYWKAHSCSFIWSRLYLRHTVTVLTVSCGSTVCQRLIQFLWVCGGKPSQKNTTQTFQMLKPNVSVTNSAHVCDAGATDFSIDPILCKYNADNDTIPICFENHAFSLEGWFWRNMDTSINEIWSRDPFPPGRESLHGPV